MKLVTTIEAEFKKILLIGLAISMVAIAIFSIFSAKQTAEKSAAFIESHIALLTEAEVNLQNISEIDRRVRQVYASWRASQGIDIRVVVYIDDKLMGQAGPLQQFGLLSVTSEKIIHLSSGNQMRLKIDVDLSSMGIFVGITTGFIFLFLLLCFWQLRKRMRYSLSQISKPLEERISWLQEVSSKLPESLSVESKTEPSNIDELSKLDQSFDTFIQRLRSLEKQVSEKSFSEGRIKMAEQVAHSLKGAIGTLNLLLQNNNNLPDAIKIEINSSIDKMMRVSSGMLDLKRNESKNNKLLSQIEEDFNPLTIISSIVEQKQKIYPNIIIQNELMDDSDVVVTGSRIDFETMISDLIDNAWEAIFTNGIINILSEQSDSKLRLIIEDNGEGIPSDHLPQLMNEGVSFKRNGNGLGLFHAKNTINAMKGTIKIHSQLGMGTKVEILLPLIPPSDKSIELQMGQTVVLVDDDEQIHRAWDIFLTPYKEKIFITHIYSPSEFACWIEANGPGLLGSRFYIFDYDLKAELTGINLVQKYSLRLEAIVISGMADSQKVINEAKEARVRLLNKNNLHKLKIELINLEAETKTPLFEAVNT